MTASAPPSEAALRAAAERCVACAACRSGCPTFDLSLEEGRSGRGRVQLVRAAFEGALDPGSARFAELISSCARCGYCAKICPVGLPATAIIDHGRALTAARRPATWRERLVLALLGRPRLRRACVAALAWWQRALGLARDGRPAPLPGLGVRKPIFRLRLRGPRGGVGGPEGGAPVRLRAGCRTEFLAPEAAEDAAFLLGRAGFRVAAPAASTCGGGFAVASGEPARGARLAAASLAEAAGARVLSMCGACDRTAGAHAGEDWAEALAAAGFAGPFFPERLAAPVIVHEPCTARYGPAGGTPIAALLRRAGVDVRPFASPACCGGAAPFSLTAPDESEALGRRAAETAAASGAATLVGSDVGCLLQFATHFGAERPRTLHAATALRLLVDASYSPSL